MEPSKEDNMAYTKQTLPAGIKAEDALAHAVEAITVAKRRVERFNQQIAWRDRKIAALEARGRDAQVEELERKLQSALRTIEDLQDQLQFRSIRWSEHLAQCGSDDRL